MVIVVLAAVLAAGAASWFFYLKPRKERREGERFHAYAVATAEREASERADGARNCLVCSHYLIPADSIVECSVCKLRYSASTLKDSDPTQWDYVRENRLFSLAFRRDRQVQHLHLEVPLHTTDSVVT